MVATNGPADSQEDARRKGAKWFSDSHPIVEIPTDPHIAEGSTIDQAKLRPRTRRATLGLAAAVARSIDSVAGPANHGDNNGRPG